MSNLSSLYDIAKEAKNDESVTIGDPEWVQLEEELKKFDMEEDSPLPEMKHLLQMNGIRCFPRGDLVAISGKEKCGKTTDCRIMISALLKGEYMGVKALEKNVRVLWIDTEQANLSSRAVLRGIKMMCGFNRNPYDRFRYSALREFPDRPKMIKAMRVLFNVFKPDIAIIDGIRDFIPDFNDVVESAEIVLECMHLSTGVSAEMAREKGLNERPACCVCCILHQNKPKDDTNMRGHLGTELSNKAGEVWEATQDDDHVFTFKQTRSRTRPVDNPLTYKVHTEIYTDAKTGITEEIGVPEIWDTESVSKANAPIPTFNTNNGVYQLTKLTAEALFFEVMKDNDAWEYQVLTAKFTQYWGVDVDTFIKLKKLLENELIGYPNPYDSNKKLWKYIGPTF